MSNSDDQRILELLGDSEDRNPKEFKILYT